MLKVLKKWYQSTDIDLTKDFEDLFAQKGIVMDEQQQRAIVHLDVLLKTIHSSNSFQKNQSIGVYLWGGVGRGKTMIMNAFFQKLKRKKIRLHYHELLQQLLNQLKIFDKTDNPMDSVIHQLADNAKVLCIDDLHIHDIVDGTLWQGVYQNAVKRKLFLVITSNYHPDKLLDIPGYQFKIRPVLDAMKQNMEIIQLDAGVDYRYQKLENPPSTRNMQDEALDAIFAQLIDNEITVQNGVITIQHRPIQYLRKNEKIIWFEFDEICGSIRSYRDYLDLSDAFSTFFVSGINEENIQDPIWLKRFIWLVDILYDRNIPFYLGSSEPVLNLIKKAPSIVDFDRTKSRLKQMLFLT